jgi:hypothetical protein
MDNLNAENTNFQISRQVSEKFEFYFIALVFTVLGLTIQTSYFSKNYYQVFFEFSAWVSLLLSGLAGLSRLEWVPVAYIHYGKVGDTKKELNMINEGLQGRTILKSLGEEWSRDDLAKEKIKLEEHIDKHNKKAKTINKRCQVKYTIHKWGFVIGVISVGISRGIIGITKILIP